jgi:branched-chain amino acid transport system permease protein
MAFNLELLIRGLYSGISFGFILILMASGLSLVFGLMGVVNFAHGELFAIGAYFGVFGLTLTNNFLVAILMAILGGVIVGLALEMIVFKPLYDRPALYQVPAAFGASIILIEVIKIVWGESSQPLPIPEYLSGTFEVLGVPFGVYRLFLIAAGIGLVLLMWLFLVRTKYGLIVRAAISETEMVQSMGYDTSRVYTLLFVFGAIYASIAGILISPLFGARPTMGSSVLINAFVVIVVGGFGSFRGIIVSGLLIGITQSLGRLYVPNFAGTIPFVIMIAILLYRPHGLFGVEVDLH